MSKHFSRPFSQPSRSATFVPLVSDMSRSINFNEPNRTSKTLRFDNITVPASRRIWMDRWDFDVNQIWNDLVEEADADGEMQPTASLKPILDMVLSTCHGLCMPEPAISHSNNGGVDVFFKKDEKGLLLSLMPDESLEAYGDYHGEIWRARLDRSMPRSKPLNEAFIVWLVRHF